MTDEQLAQLISALKERPDPFQVSGRILGLALAVLMMIGAWMVKGQNTLTGEVAELRTAVAVMDGNRFTATAGLQMEARIVQERMALWADMVERLQRLEGYHATGGTTP